MTLLSVFGHSPAQGRVLATLGDCLQSLSLVGPKPDLNAGSSDPLLFHQYFFVHHMHYWLLYQHLRRIASYPLKFALLRPYLWEEGQVFR